MCLPVLTLYCLIWHSPSKILALGGPSWSLHVIRLHAWHWLAASFRTLAMGFENTANSRFLNVADQTLGSIAADLGLVVWLSTEGRAGRWHHCHAHLPRLQGALPLLVFLQGRAPP